MKMKSHDGLHLLMDCKLFANMRSEILINLCFFGRTVEGKSFQNRVRFSSSLLWCGVGGIAVQRSYRPQRKSQKGSIVNEKV